MEKEIIDSAIIDPNLASYEQFFDHSWCKRIFELVDRSPLQAAVDILVVAWRSTNGVHMLPWLMVQSLIRFAEGEFEAALSFRTSYSDTVVQGIVEKLETRLPGLDFDQRTALRLAVTKIEEEAFQVLKTAKSQVNVEATGYWDLLTHTSEFPFCILGSQHINYGSLFFAYEDFLASTIRTKEPAFSSKSNPIRGAFSKHFGAPLTDYCWNHDEVDLAKLVRHALAHNGGRYGTDLDKYKPRFVDATRTNGLPLRGDLFNIVDGKIQITPCNTKYLFSVLKDRVTRIVEEFVGRTSV